MSENGDWFELCVIGFTRGRSVRVYGEFALMQSGDGSRDLIPPNASGQFGCIGSIVRIKPLLLFVCIECGASFGVTMGSVWDPTWSVPILASGITMTVVVSMFGAIVNDLEPFVSLTVTLHYSLAGWLVLLLLLLLLLFLELLFIHFREVLKFLFMEDPFSHELPK